MPDTNETNKELTKELSKELVKENQQNEGIILNSKIADSSSKIIFDDPILCAQFLRDYIDLPYLKDVQPDHGRRYLRETYS